MKTRVAFIQKRCVENLGVMSLAALLEAKGYGVEVFVHNCEKDILSSVREYGPQIACFSCATGEHLWALEVAGKLKKKSPVFTVFGGPHPTSVPDILEHPSVDSVCFGEGEYPLLELAESFERGSPAYNIKNLHIKNKGKIIRNPLRPPIDDLDTLPFPARTIYHKYKFMRSNPTRIFAASRGCSFDCSYCYGHLLKDIYGKEGYPVRYKSSGYFINELKEAKEKYNFKTVFFKDDAFVYNRGWLAEFLPRYKAEIGKPFICDMPVPDMTDDLAERLKDAGCFRVTVSVGTGDEQLRSRVLNKDVSDSQIIESVRMLRSRGMEIATDNMLGLPGETLRQAFKTVYLNVKIKPDYLMCSMLQPYPNTEIEKLSLREGLIKAGYHDFFPATYFKDSPLRQKDIKKLVRLQKFFILAVKFPSFIPVIKMLIRLPFKAAYHIAFIPLFAYQYKMINRFTFLYTAQFGLRSLPLYTKT